MVVVTMVDGQVDRVVDHVGYCTDFTFLFFFFFPAGCVLVRSCRVIPFGREECINEVPKRVGWLDGVGELKVILRLLLFLFVYFIS